MTPHGQATRFRVWQAYHQLAKELRRIPTGEEIADASGVNYDMVKWHVCRLDTCPMEESTRAKLDVASRGAIPAEREIWTNPPVDTFIQSHGGAR